MLNIVNGELKQNLINSLRLTVVYIKRNNIRVKWENILKNHSSNQDYSTICDYSQIHQIDNSNYTNSKHKPTSSEGSLLVGKAKSYSTTNISGRKKNEKNASQANKLQQIKSTTEKKKVSPLNQSTISKSSLAQPIINVNQIGSIPFINYTTYYNYNHMAPQFTQNLQSSSIYQQQFFPVNPQPQIYQLFNSNSTSFYQGNNSYTNYPQARPYSSKSGFK